MARRDAERIAREKQLHAILADFYQAQGEVERIHCAAHIAAVPFEDSIRAAVSALDSLGETRAGIAGLTGLSLPRVREYLVETASSESGPNRSSAERPVRRGSLHTAGRCSTTPPAERAVADS